MSEKIGKWKTKDYLVLGSLLIVAAGASVIVYNKLKITCPQMAELNI